MEPGTEHLASSRAIDLTAVIVLYLDHSNCQLLGSPGHMALAPLLSAGARCTSAPPWPALCRGTDTTCTSSQLETVLVKDQFCRPALQLTVSTHSYSHTHSQAYIGAHAPTHTGTHTHRHMLTLYKSAHKKNTAAAIFVLSEKLGAFSI